MAKVVHKLMVKLLGNTGSVGSGNYYSSFLNQFVFIEILIRHLEAVNGKKVLHESFQNSLPKTPWIASVLFKARRWCDVPESQIWFSV